MSGVTDLSFRLISRKHGARHCFFEMLDSNAVTRDHPRNKDLIKTLKQDSPVSAQLVGNDPSMMADAAEKLLDLVKISSLDINSACPAKKVVKKGAGAALLKDKIRLGKIVKVLASRLPIPVTVKLRTGVDLKDTKECINIAKACQANGASVIFIHGRTLVQGYSGGIDYESIGAVKKAVTIPVFGSGDIFDHLLAKKMLDETGCDGILVARGALGNPWIFADIEEYLKTCRSPAPRPFSVKKSALKEHLAYIEKYKYMPKGNKTAIMCKVAMWYLKGIPSAARIREHIFKMRSYVELIELVDGIKS